MLGASFTGQHHLKLLKMLSVTAASLGKTKAGLCTTSRGSESCNWHLLSFRLQLAML